MTDGTMSKALEAARRAIEAHPAYDCGSTGDEEMALAAVTAYLAHLAEDEAVLERVKAALDPYMAQPIIYQSVEGAALIALKSLAGKE